MYQEAEAVNAH